MPVTKVLEIQNGPLTGAPIDVSSLKPGWVMLHYRTKGYTAKGLNGELADYNSTVNELALIGEKAWVWFDGQSLTWHPQKPE